MIAFAAADLICGMNLGLVCVCVLHTCPMGFVLKKVEQVLQQPWEVLHVLVSTSHTQNRGG